MLANKEDRHQMLEKQSKSEILEKQNKSGTLAKKNKSEIKIENLTYVYAPEDPPVLSNISGVFQSNEITVLSGASGCGKSTLLYLMAGLYPHYAGQVTKGSIMIDGQNPAKLEPPVRCRLTGMMFQNPDLQFCMDTVFRELSFCLENICTPPEHIPALAEEALTFCGIQHLRERKLATLSGGEKQKVMLACVKALSPKWLLLDEPFANVDEAGIRELAEKLLELHQTEGTGIIAVDHRLEGWMHMADRLLLLEDGKLKDVPFFQLEKQQVQDARTNEEAVQTETGGETAAEISRETNRKTSRETAAGAIIETTGAAATERAAEIETTSETEAATAFEKTCDALETAGVIIPGRPYAVNLPAPSPGETVLEIKGLSVRRGEKEILHNLHAEWKSGMIYAILGDSGCGKSTLFGALSGLYPYQGEILLCGRKLHSHGLSGFLKSLREKRTLRKASPQGIPLLLEKTAINKGCKNHAEQQERACFQKEQAASIVKKTIKSDGKGEAFPIGFVTQNPQDQFVATSVAAEIMAGQRRYRRGKQPDGRLAAKEMPALQQTSQQRPTAAMSDEQNGLHRAVEWEQTGNMQGTPEQRCEAILRGIHLWAYRDVSPYMLSQGQQRRLGCAALMACNLKVLVCDEPTYAQDRINTVSIMDALCRAAREQNMTLVFSTHDSQLARSYADQVYCLRDGALLPV